VTRMVKSRTYARLRGIFGGLFVLLGALIVFQIAHGVGFHIEAAPGILLGIAMIGLGIVRIRGAIATWKSPQ
jgi:hypothetical protein